MNAGDSFRQILTDWNASASATVSTRLKVTGYTPHPNDLSAGSGRNWSFFTKKADGSNRKSSDRLN